MKWLKIIGVAVFLLVVATIAIVSTQGYRMEREIDSKIAAIKANGDPVCGKDLFPPVADAKNGAPLYERVLAMVESDKDIIDNAFSVSSSCKLKKNPELLVSSRQMAAKYKSIVPLIEQASAYPQFRFKTNWNDPPEEILFPYYAKLRRLFRLLSEIAIVDAMDGRTNDSIRAVKSGYYLSESIKREHTLIGFLVRCSFIAITSKSLKTAMQYGNVSEADAHDLFTYLGEFEFKSGLINAMKGERAIGIDMLERARKNGFRKDGISSKKSLNRIPWLLNIRACADELYYLNYMLLPIDAVSKPIDKTITKKGYAEPEVPKYAIMSSILIPIYAGCKTKQYETMSTIAGDRTFLAVLAYKSKLGSYPQDLQQVEKSLGWKLPQDPLGKGLFKYRREGKGFVIYGFGRNRKDDKASTVKALEKTDPGFSNQINKYPYINGDGTRSADMIWQKDK